MHKLMVRRVASLVACAVLTVSPAWALDAKKGAMNVAKSAASAYESGDMARAAQLYLEAYRIDASESTFLYGAARAEQAAGQFDRAEAHFRQFVGLKTADPDRVARALGYLDELAGIRADQKAEAAERFARRGEWPLAAAAYREASRLKPDRVFLSYRAAVAAHEGGDNPQAIELLHTYLAKAHHDAPDHAEAQLLLDALTGKAKPAQREAPKPPEPVKSPEPAKSPEPLPVAAPVQTPAPVVVQTPTPPPVVVHDDPGMTPRQIAAWSTLGGGALVALVGGIVLGVAKSQATTFVDGLGYDGTRVHTTLDYDAATAKANTLANRETVGAVMLGAGALAAGMGAVMLLTAPTRAVTASTDGRTLLLAWRF